MNTQFELYQKKVYLIWWYLMFNFKYIQIANLFYYSLCFLIIINNNLYVDTWYCSLVFVRDARTVNVRKLFLTILNLISRQYLFYCITLEEITKISQKSYFSFRYHYGSRIREPYKAPLKFEGPWQLCLQIRWGRWFHGLCHWWRTKLCTWWAGFKFKSHTYRSVMPP